MSHFHDLDLVRILIPVSGISVAGGLKVSFPKGTEGVVISASDSGGLVEIGWAAPDNLSCDGLIVPLHNDQMELVEAFGG